MLPDSAWDSGADVCTDLTALIPGATVMSDSNAQTLNIQVHIAVRTTAITMTAFMPVSTAASILVAGTCAITATGAGIITLAAIIKHRIPIFSGISLL